MGKPEPRQSSSPFSAPPDEMDDELDSGWGEETTVPTLSTMSVPVLDTDAIDSAWPEDEADDGGQSVPPLAKAGDSQRAFGDGPLTGRRMRKPEIPRSPGVPGDLQGDWRGGPVSSTARLPKSSAESDRPTAKPRDLSPQAAAAAAAAVAAEALEVQDHPGQLAGSAEQEADEAQGSSTMPSPSSGVSGVPSDAVEATEHPGAEPEAQTDEERKADEHPGAEPEAQSAEGATAGAQEQAEQPTVEGQDEASDSGAFARDSEPGTSDTDAAAASHSSTDAPPSSLAAARAAAYLQQATTKSSGRWLVAGAAALVLGGLTTLALLSGSGKKEAAIAEPEPTPSAVLPASANPPASALAPASSRAELALGQRTEAAAASAAVSAVASAEAVEEEAEEQEPKSGKTRSVKVRVRPFAAQIYHNNCKLGEGTVTVEVEVGKRKKLRVVHEGYATRKLVIDGSRRTVKVGMVPLPPDADESDTDEPSEADSE